MRRRVFLKVSMMLVVGALLLSVGGVTLADAPDKNAILGLEPGASQPDIVVLTNGIYELSITDDTEWEPDSPPEPEPGVGYVTPGVYTVCTGDDHPVPNADVLYDGADHLPGTSYLTVRDYTDAVDYIPDPTASSSEPSGGYGIDFLGGCGSEFSVSGKKATTTWNPGGGLEVEQVTAVEGTTLSDSRVRVTTTVTNNDDVTHEVGIRYEWDLMIADDDDAWFARRNPDASFTQDELIYEPPNFERFETTDDPGNPTFSVFGSVNGPQGVFSPDPTPPDRFIFGEWAQYDAWDYYEGSDPSSDSAVLYYWGYDDGNSPISLSPGESVSVTAYLYAIPAGYEEPGQFEEEEESKPEKKERPLEPARMMANYLSIDPQQVLPGQEVRISANVCNSGELRGSETAVLSVNGAAEQSQSVAVSGGSCKQVVFTTAKAVPGTYQVSVNGMEGQFSVLAPRIVQASVASSQDVGLGTWGIVAIAAVVIVLVIGLVVIFKQN
ncbi:MAG: hypothetical protein JW846_10930 [Dehalococcoidia bacterium]|nr:hypothetical protein [Dehalococcoidia bacterium]